MPASPRVQLDAGGWPSLLPPLPPLAWQVTRAGLLEWQGMDCTGAPELRLCGGGPNPALLAARVLAGELPRSTSPATRSWPAT
jgi:ubiquinone biosynthesis protein UbiJ